MGVSGVVGGSCAIAGPLAAAMRRGRTRRRKRTTRMPVRVRDYGRWGAPGVTRSTCAAWWISPFCVLSLCLGMPRRSSLATRSGRVGAVWDFLDWAQQEPSPYGTVAVLPRPRNANAATESGA